MQTMEAFLERQSSVFGSVGSLKETSVPVCSKRQREPVVSSPEKRVRMVADSNLTRQCSDLLKAMKTNPTLDPTSVDELSTSNRALREEMLKCRFADAIFKAQEKKKQLDNEKADSMKIKQEKETFKRRLLKEKATSKQRLLEGKRKIEAQLTMTDVKSKRQRDRNAARIALEKMENTAGIEINLDAQKEFEILIGCYSSSSWESIRSRGFPH